MKTKFFFLALSALAVILTSTGAESGSVSYCETTGELVSTGFGIKGADDEHLCPIYRIDPSNGTKVRIWLSSASVAELALSPAGSRIGFIERLWNSSEQVSSSNLRVIDTNGAELAFFPDVYQFDWSPDGGKIAYQGGRCSEGTLWGFDSTGTWVYDFKTKSSKKIFESGLRLQWARFDGNLYILRGSLQMGDVLCYFPEEDTLRNTPYKDINFSPSGKYYYRPGYEGSGFEIYDRSSNENVTENWYYLALRSGGADLRGWLEGDILVLPFIDGDELLDMNSGVVTKSSGTVFPGTRQGKSIFAWVDFEIVMEQLDRLPIIPPKGRDLDATPQVYQGSGFGYELLAEIPLDARPEILELSPSGKHITVEFSSTSDHFLAVYTNLDQEAAYTKRMPGTSFSWAEGDTLMVQIPNSNGQGLALPPYVGMQDVEQAYLREPASLPALQQLEAAAWLYTENSISQIPAPAETISFPSLSELSAATREAFMPAGAPKPRSWHLDQLAAASALYLVDQDGRRVVPGAVSPLETKRIYLQQQDGDIEITSADSGSVRHIAYDSGTQRILLDTRDEGFVLYDLRSNARHLLPCCAECGATFDYRLAPGRDYVVVRVTPRSQYVDPWLELWRSDGTPLKKIILPYDGRADIWYLQVSQDLLAACLVGFEYDQGRKVEKNSSLLVFRAVD